MSWNYKTPPAFAPDAVPTEKGWEAPLKGTNPADGLTELVVAVGQMPLKAGPGEVVSVRFGEESYEQGDALSVIIRFSENVNIEAGTSIVVSVPGNDTGPATYTLHALAQNDVLEGVFDQVVTLDDSVLISEDETVQVELIIEAQMISNGDIVDADEEGEDIDLAISADIANAAGTRVIPLP